MAHHDEAIAIGLIVTTSRPVRFAYVPKPTEDDIFTAVRLSDGKIAIGTIAIENPEREVYPVE